MTEDILVGVSWYSLGIVVLFVLISVTCIYLINCLINLLACIKTIRTILEQNTENINKTLKNSPKITDNIFEITELVKNESDGIKAIIKNISNISNSTSSAMNGFKDDIMHKVLAFIEFLTMLKNHLLKDESEEKNDNPTS